MPAAPDNPVFWKLFNAGAQVHRFLFQRTGGRIGGRGMGNEMLLLHHTGRRSGEERVAPLLYLPDGDDLVIVASKGGNPRHPAWFHNLMAMDATEVELKGSRRRVRPVLAEGEDRAQLWTRLVAAYGDYAAYQKATDREIPVVRLKRS